MLNNHNVDNRMFQSISAVTEMLIMARLTPPAKVTWTDRRYNTRDKEH